MLRACCVRVVPIRVQRDEGRGAIVPTCSQSPVVSPVAEDPEERRSSFVPEVLDREITTEIIDVQFGAAIEAARPLGTGGCPRAAPTYVL